MGSDSHDSSSSSQNTTTVINVTNNYNTDDPSKPKPPQPFIDSLLKWLISAYNAQGGSSAPKPTGDAQIDLQATKTLLYDMATNLFDKAFSYQYNGGSSSPPNQVGTLFESMEDFTNCPSTNESALDSYVDNYVFPLQGMPVSGYNIKELQNDLVGVLNPLLHGAPFEGWNNTEYKRNFTSTDNSKNLGVNAKFIYTVVNATDGNGDAQPWLFLYYLGGYFDEAVL